MNYEGSRILVTGGAGVVGSYLVEQLVQKGALVTVADNFARGRPENLASVNGSTRQCHADLMQEGVARDVCVGQDMVFHLAAKVAGIQYNVAHHSEMLRVNLTLTGNVLEAAARAGVARCLVVSSACVYPQDALVPTPESEADRGTPEPDNEGYGWAKRMSERLAGYYTQEYGMAIAVVRPFNIYSPRDNFAEASHAIPGILRRLFNGEDPLSIWGSGTQTRTFLHAADLARAMRLVLDSGTDAGPVNVGSDREVSMSELAQLICTAAGVPASIRFDTSRPEGHRRRAPDISKLRALTGWEPQVSLEDGLKDTATSYRAWQDATARH